MSFQRPKLKKSLVKNIKLEETSEQNKENESAADPETIIATEVIESKIEDNVKDDIGSTHDVKDNRETEVVESEEVSIEVNDVPEVRSQEPPYEGSVLTITNEDGNKIVFRVGRRKKRK